MLKRGVSIIRKTEFFLLIILVAATFSLGFMTSDYLREPSVTGNIVLSELPEKTYEATIDIVAVRMQGEIGIVNTATVEIIEGRGRVLFSLNPFVEPDTQESAEIAKSVAEAYTQKSLAAWDVIYSIDAGNVQLVGGPSAGAALTAATIAAIEGKQIRGNVEITGTINSDGSIGQVGGIIEKIAASAQAGKTVFLLPQGQGVLQYYEPQVTREQQGPFVIERTTYVTKTLDLNEYVQEQGWGIE
ncbi:MAG: hypothetical protein JW772_00215, partial [Candidatus Diapherotrites archaeon]|nr:hypothetical protein [Candidatus Diapherotrites archaeon]